LRVRVHPLQVPDILRVLDHWIQERRRVHCVFSTGMHGATESPQMSDQVETRTANGLLA
jgi:hypothetical protein